ncbi:UDP-4-keto-6-deoxy-N-acetylglucosamine4-aminotra nsferase [Denitrovibrio acetiphilus DSM 12809]|uniref:UDP-4-keto-6-deoxy-N-acetylglucosamine4-aminotra nsferase n=1 Tax=Denitrovibrio acetiphilus (strain DSM 12809 / NBRC 114555 / N2460) TaxID=522772 RepID=D4H3E2_DENA2|nr:UDP-4-amino-4,6-dideoxy-N-acetyl-beta-L-altrosamine transaminase [Denitrovibrio acetiphilus]ADD67226.1 UDP-4-keto-6-deoxy-N-acetylglucosamine4-aminotra nsferase [Denitrovibrio acetiphilus DSM 12809]
MKFIPYGKQSLDKSDIDAVAEVLKSDFLTTGPAVEKFEDAISEYTGATYTVAVSSGTAALHLSALCLIKPGEKVLVSAVTFAATANAVFYAGGIPVFCDIDDEGNIDLDLCVEMIRSDTSIRHLIVTHMTGRPVDQDKLEQLKDRFDISIIEDCAHSFGASFKGQMAGRCPVSDCSVLSFHPVKHITTGEGGAVTTNSERLYRRIRLLRSHGITKDEMYFKNNSLAYDSKGNLNPWYYEMQDLGFNYRITDIQCALGLSQMKRLDGFVSRRREIAKMYEDIFSQRGIFTPLYNFDKNSSYHLYVVQVPFDNLPVTKAEFFNEMRDCGVGLQLHYIPVPMLPYYADKGYNMRNLHEAELYYARSFSIPMYPAMEDKDVRFVADCLYKSIK